MSPTLQDRLLSAGPLGRLLALVLLTFRKVFLLKGLKFMMSSLKNSLGPCRRLRTGVSVGSGLLAASVYFSVSWNV